MLKDWLKRLFGNRAVVKPKVENSSAARTTAAVPSKPIPATTAPSRPLIIPVAMLNTITLSSDQRQLFLIDGGKLLAFPLFKGGGVSIGLLDGQLAVVSARGDEEAAAESSLDLEAEAILFKTSAEASNSKAGASKTLRLPLKANTQYTLGYNAANQAMGIIGATDIISTITVPDHSGEGPTAGCQVHLFDLSKHNLHLQLVKDELLVTAKLR